MSTLASIAFEISEISSNVLQWIGEGSTYKFATLVCRLWHRICSTELQWMVSSYSNHLLTLIKHHPDILWDWNWLLQNPNTTWEFIQSNLDKIPSDEWWWMSCNPNITWEIVRTNLHRSWDWGGLSRNPNITWDIIDFYSDSFSVGDFVSQNPNITWEIVEANSHRYWNSS